MRDNKKRNLRFWTLQILFILLIVLVSTKVSFIFIPIVVFATTLFFPVIISGFLFFLLSPMVKFLESKRIPKILAILIMYIVGIGVLLFAFTLIGRPAMTQLTNLVQQIPDIVNNIRLQVIEFSTRPLGETILSQVDVNQLSNALMNSIQSFVYSLLDRATSIFSIITNIALTLILVPYLLFYMLKDGHSLQKQILKFFPNSFCDEGEKIIKETTSTVANYIQGQLMVCSFVGGATMIGYFIIGLDYALLFGIFIGVFNMIPFLGPWIGMAPAVVIGFLHSPLQGILAIAVVALVQQAETSIVTPLIMGSRLKVYPLTIMLLLIVAGNLAGIMGMLLAVPTYAVVKVLVRNFIRIWKLRRNAD